MPEKTRIIGGYVRPESLDQLLHLIAEAGDRATILAGGTDLMPEIRAGRRGPLLVNLFRLEALRTIRLENSGAADHASSRLFLGAAVTVARLLRSPEVRRHAPLLWQAADRFASPLIRSRATIGGNLCNASPAADLVLALLASDAEIEIAALAGCRRLPLEQFVHGPGQTALQDGEVVVGVRLPLADPGRYCRFEKSGSRPALEISVAAVATALTLEDGRVKAPRIACGAVASVSRRAREAESLIEGRGLGARIIEQAARAAAAEIRPIDDVRGSALYRRRLVAAFVRRSLVEAGNGRDVHE
jgi:CO/xanthine dehydrogenase FAD-binding subunit